LTIVSARAVILERKSAYWERKHPPPRKRHYTKISLAAIGRMSVE
jgi:hypothetical protein